MKPPLLRRLRRLRWFVAGLWAASLSLAGGGCMSVAPAPLPRSISPQLQSHHLQGLQPTQIQRPVLHQTSYQPGEEKEKKPGEAPGTLPAPREALPPAMSTKASPAPSSVPLLAAPGSARKPVAVSLDLVFRLAEEQNPRIAQVRETVQERCLEADQRAREACLPAVSVGLGYYRHEGGIQHEDGRLTNSSFGSVFPGLQINTGLDLRQGALARLQGQREETRSRAELVKMTNEVLLEAATTYVDLLAARRAEAVAREAERMQTEMLQRAEKLAEEEPLAKLISESARSEVLASRQQAIHFHQQGNSAAAKLAYLLGLGCDVQVTPIDADLVPLHLIDVNPPVEILVGQVQETGPGVREMQELLGAIHLSIAEADSVRKYLPTVQLTVSEGALIAGPGASADIRNRLDMMLGVRWNLTDFCTAREKRAVALSKLAQVEFQAQELRSKLALAVEDGRETILASRERFKLAGAQVKAAAEVYRLGREAILENLPPEKVKISDVMAAIRGLRDTHLAHVQTVQNHNHAQVRLLLLLKGR